MPADRARAVCARTTLLVGALAARRGGKRRALHELLPAGRSVLSSARNMAESLSGRAGFPPKRRRRLLRAATKRIDRASSVASRVGTFLGLAAAGMELVSAIREQAREGPAQNRRAGPARKNDGRENGGTRDNHRRRENDGKREVPEHAR